MWAFPSGDIHLLRQTGDASLRVCVTVPFANLHGEWKDASTVEGLTLTIEQRTGGPNVQHAGTGYAGAMGPATAAVISPSPVSGTSFHLLKAALKVSTGENTSDIIPHDGMIRVSTHDDVAQLYAGDRSLHMFRGESDRVISVYAQFTDRPAGVLEDVTGHAFLKYDVANAAIATVDAEGRIHGVAVGSTTIGVQTWDNRFRFTVALTVRMGLEMGLEAPRIEPLARQTARQAASVYLLAEGYTDANRFFTHARKIVKSWLATRPYKYLASRYNVVGIFQPSADRGVTIGPRIGASPTGAPASVRTLWEGGQPLPTGITLSRDTLFGLSAGNRATTCVLSQNLGRPVDEAPAVFYERSIQYWRAIQPDERRLPRFGVDDLAGFEPVPPDAGFASFIRRYVAAAGFVAQPDDRVLFLVDDDVFGGLRVDVEEIDLVSLPMVTASVGTDPWISNVVAAGPLLDRTITGATLDEASVGSLVSHELAHTYSLADEYEDRRKRTYDNHALADQLKQFDNVQHDAWLRVAGNDNPLRGDPTQVPPVPAGALDVTRIKWNIHRVAKISPAIQIAATSGQHRLTLARGQAARWSAGERAFLRNSLLVAKDVQVEPRTTAISVKIVTTDPVHDTVDVQITAGFDIATLGPKPLLYVAKTNGDGAEVGLIDPAVLAFLAANGPFPKGQPCVGGDPKHFDDDRACPSIPNFSRPSNNADAIGLYEGGGHYSCDIYRPAGRCKMRKLSDAVVEDTTGLVVKFKTEIIGFCFVCSYILVDRIDASQHERLDRDYPRDC